jgi:hypothetical protein
MNRNVTKQLIELNTKYYKDTGDLKLKIGELQDQISEVSRDDWNY